MLSCGTSFVIDLCPMYAHCGDMDTIAPYDPKSFGMPTFVCTVLVLICIYNHYVRNVV